MSYFKDAIAIDLETSYDLWNKPYIISISDEEGNITINDANADLPVYINNKLWIGHNIAMFDLPILVELGYKPRTIWDTQLVEQWLSGGNLKHFPKYSELVEKYCGVKLDKELQTSDWSVKLTAEQIEYCKNDVKYLKEIATKQYEAVVALGMLPFIDLFHNVASLWFHDIWSGFPLDVKKREELQYACDVEYKKHLVTLLDYIDVKLLLKSNYTQRALRLFEAKVSPYNINLVPLGPKEKPTDDYDFEKFKDYLRVTADFDSSLFVNPSASAFASKVAAKYGVNLENYDAKQLNDFIVENPEHPFTEVIHLIMKLRTISKIKGTYANDNPDLYGTHKDGTLRVKPGFSTTITGRLTFTPYAQIPRPDEDDESGDSFRNKLQAMYVPPAGYITLCADYGAMESVAAGLFYRDAFKLQSVTEGFDPYLLLASKVFKFDYTSVDQTKQLKKDKKPLRQAMKAVELARNFGAGVWKLDEMMANICQKQNLPAISGRQVLEAWNSLYPNLAEAFDNTKDSIVSALEHFSDYEPNRRGKQSNHVLDALHDAQVLISVGNTFGLQRIDPAHKICNWIRTPQYINFPIQSSCSIVTLLAVYLVKTQFPSILIPTTIHDSLIMFVPASGINELSLDTVKDSVVKLMQLAFWTVFNSSIKVDAGYTTCGLKGD